MPRFRACRAEIEGGDEPRFEDDDVEVRIEGDRMLLCYWDDRGVVVFEGPRGADGRFALRARSRPRVASVVLLEERGVVEGTWREGDASGVLRVELGEEQE